MAVLLLTVIVAASPKLALSLVSGHWTGWGEGRVNILRK